MKEMIILDDLSSIDARYHKILSFDPSEIYERLGDLIDPYKRRNSISVVQVFRDKDDGTCACGCGKKLEGRRRRWATEDRHRLPLQVTNIINGDTDVIRPIIAQLYGGYKCFKCNRTDNDFPRTLDLPTGGWRRDFTEKERKAYNKQYNRAVYDMASKIHLDHIIPVHQGGGGCYLSNWQFLCKICHAEKTREERNPFKKALQDKKEIEQAFKGGKPISEHIKLVRPF